MMEEAKTKTNMLDVGFYMHGNPVSVEKTTSWEGAFEVMEKEQVRHLLVVDSERLIGILSKEDLMRKLLQLTKLTTGRTYNEIQLRTTRVVEIMTADPITLKIGDHLDYAIELLLQEEFHSLPVVNRKGWPVGIVTAFDLLKGYYKTYG